MKKGQRGFAVLEVLLILVILAVLTGTFWFVWKSNKDANDSLNNSDSLNSSALQKIEPIKTYEDCKKSKTSTIDKNAFPQSCTTKAGKKFTDPNPYADWKKYVSKTGMYSLKYPAKWSADVCDPAATDLVLYLGPTKASSVICNSEHPSQIMIVSTSAVPTASEQKLPSTYGNQKSKKVTVDGVTGTRQSGKLTKAEDGPTTLPAGTIAVEYIFLTPGRSYILIYAQAPSGDFAADNLEFFDLMVQKTMQFTK
jgi:type II secretory pathway pseudopilin PulG